MAPALVLTEEKAAEAGISGVGPFMFAGFPGVYNIGQPLAIEHLGRDEDELRSIMDGESPPPLEWTTVAAGEGEPERENHVQSLLEARAAAVDEAVEEKAGGGIGSHKEADAVAAELGIAFPDGMKLAEKVEAIDTVRAGGTFTPPAPEDETPATEGDQG